MAKIIPSALISAITGKLRGDCFQIWKSTNIMRSCPHVKSSNVLRSVKYRSIVSEISSCHYLLTSSQKIAWSCYASLYSSNISGFNSFISRNTALLMANHPDLCLYFDAPVIYNPPAIPSSIGLCYYPDSNTYCLFWSQPNCILAYVQGFYAPQLRFSNQVKPKLKFFSTVRSDDLHILFDSSPFTSNTMIRFSARSINVYGEVSLYTPVVPPPDLPHSVAVLSPNGGESYVFNQPINITWRSKEIDNIKIEGSIDNGISWNLINNEVLASLSSYLWTIPCTSSSLCLIKISDTDYPDISDQSDSTFTITND